jgi:hypothetical protein
MNDILRNSNDGDRGRKLLTVIIPVAVIRFYWLAFPAPMRSLWSFGTGSSGKALAEARAGAGWSVFARYANPLRAFENQSWDN